MANAWERWGGTEATVVETIRNMGEDTARLSRLLHQASFLSGSMRSGETLDWRTSAGWLVRACAAAAGRGQEDGDGDPEGEVHHETQEGGEADDDMECAVHTWAARCNGE